MNTSTTTPEAERIAQRIAEDDAAAERAVNAAENTLSLVDDFREETARFEMLRWVEEAETALHEAIANLDPSDEWTERLRSILDDVESTRNALED